MRILWRAIIALLVVASLGYTALSLFHSDSGSFGFTVHRVNDLAMVVDTIDPAGAAASAGIRKGDLLFGISSFESHVVIFATAPADRITVHVGNPKAPALALAARPDTAGQSLPFIGYVLVLSHCAFLLMGGLIAWRRSDDAAARSLATFLVCFGAGMSVGSDPAQIHPAWGRFAGYVFSESMFFLGAIGVLSFASRFPHPAPIGWRRTIARSVVPFAVFGTAVSPKAPV